MAYFAVDDSAVPDTGGTIVFRFHGNPSGVVIDMKCDVVAEPTVSIIGVALESVTMHGPYESGEGFAWRDTYLGDYPGVSATVSIR